MGKIAVVGCGWMGRAIVYALHKLGHDLILIERDGKAAMGARSQWKSVGLEMSKEIPDWFATEVDEKLFEEDVDLVVSAAPYVANLTIGPMCVDHGVRYCDLGGNPKISKEIQFYADKKQTHQPVFTDLGMAPGHINFVAEDILERDLKIESLFLYVGGLPQRHIATGKLKYNLVFSLEGLINEYSGHCEILENGKIVEANTLTGLEDFGDYEAFYTKGGLTLDAIKAKGVKNCAYRTIRYKGHRDCIQFLLEDTHLPQNEIRDILRHTCPPIKDDLIKICVRYKVSSPWNFFNLLGTEIKADKNWTAMQIGTAYPAAAVASLMAQGKMDGKPVLNYSDVGFDEYQHLLYNIDKSVPWDLYPLDEF